MRAVANPVPQTFKTDAFILQGGLDEVTPTLRLKPGTCRYSVNYEAAVTGGYARIGGYERFDGRARPSAATYSIVQVVSFTNTPTVGQTLTGQTSGATGQIIAVGSNYLALTLIVGSFTTSEVVKVGATTIGTATPSLVIVSALMNAQYLALAADVYRGLIGVVPGSGPIRGVVSANFSGVHTVYAFRDNAGATATLLYQSSGSGWTAVTLYNEIAFTVGGASQPAEGATLTQGAVTATVKRVAQEKGSWSGNTAQGRFIITNPAGGNFAAGAATVTGGITVTLSGVQTAISFTPGGKFEFDYANVQGGTPSTARLYGCDGVNRCFEFDGAILVPINTFATPDTPKHLKVHRLALVVTIRGSVLISGPGTPYMFDATMGGAALSMHDTATGLMVLPAGNPGGQTMPTMAVMTTNETWTLYGSSASGSQPWALVPFNEGVGALDYSCQILVDGYMMINRGIWNLTAAKEYGNFQTGSLSFGLQNTINSKKGLLSCSSVHRTKSQYRVFFSDGSGIFMTIINAPVVYPQISVGRNVGAMPILYPDPINVVWNSETTAGEEVTYAGSLSGGYIFMLDIGSSCDGAALNAQMTLAHTFMKTPRQYKDFKLASLEISGSFYAAIQVGYYLGYGDVDVAQPVPRTYSSNLSATPFWDQFTWDNFTWDGMTLAPTEIPLEGQAVNIQYTIGSGTNYIQSYTLTTMMTHYLPMRLVNG